VLRVHRLQISERTGATSEKATVELIVDFLRPEGTGYVTVLRAAQVVESSGIEVTGKHAGNITKALQNCLLQLNGTTAATSRAPLTLAQLQQPDNALQPLELYPIMQAAQPKPGIYRTFEQFCQNTPENLRLAIIARTPRKEGEWAGIDDVEVYYEDEPGNRTPIRDAWGYSDGQNVYILHQRHFFLLERSGNSYSFLGHSQADPQAVANGALVGGVVGGALGGAIGGAVAAANTSGHKQLHDLHLLTGHVVAKAAESDWDETGADTARVVVYQRDLAVTRTEVKVNGNSVGDLRQAGVITVPWTDKRRELNLCVEADTEQTCQNIRPKFTSVNYYEFVPGASPALKPVLAKEGEFYLKRLRLQVRRNQAKAQKTD
jgi:hypothetical protein